MRRRVGRGRGVRGGRETALREKDKRHDRLSHYRTAEVDGRDVFYREAGAPGAPKLLLLHGFPTPATCSAT